MQANEEILAVNALKSIARNEGIKAHIQRSPDLYGLLLRAAKRFVTGETKEECIARALNLMSKGYLVSLEYIGENTKTDWECVNAKDEFMRIIRSVGDNGVKSTISLDLSHIGLSVDPDLTYSNLAEIAEEAVRHDLTVMISMEESAKTDQIFELYKKTARSCPNVGITVQAHLYRTEKDLRELLDYPGRIRIVKGAYQEPSAIAIPRSRQLDERYIQFVEIAVKAGHPVSIASHDETVIEEVRRRGYLEHPHAETEMLYGIRPGLLRALNGAGYRTKVYLTYGKEWYLYLCHRLAEYPPNIYVAIADIVEPARTEAIPY